MPKYIKNPERIVHAEQWDGTDEHALKLRLIKEHISDPIDEKWNETHYYYNDKWYGKQKIENGDYIITDAVGSKYIAKKDYFEREYSEYEE